MGSFSLFHGLIVLILFGAGRIPKAMGDLARAADAEAGRLVETADQKSV